MQLKSSRQPLLRRLAPRGRAPRLLLVGALAALGLAAGGLLRVGPAKALARAQRFAELRVVQTLASLRAEPEVLRIDLAHRHFQKIAAKRDEALATGLLVASPDDLVPATVTHRGGTADVKLRLKGDLPDHWEGEKWSLRIEVKRDGALLGMRRFSIQHPRTRGYLDEWLLHRILRRQGLPALRYDFVEVVLNGKDLGIYALEEHFDKHLLEASGRREGPIVRFNEDLCWAEVAQGQVHPLVPTQCMGSGGGSFLAADVDGFHTQKLLADATRRDLYVRAVHLLQLFRNGELETSDVFDVDLLARHFAILEILDRIHASYWRNARFYYNPITARLEPIAFDGGSEGQPSTPFLAPALTTAIGSEDDPLSYYYSASYHDRLFADPAFYAAYVRELERVAAPGWLEEQLEAEEEPLARALDVLHTEFPYVALDMQKLERRRQLVRSWLAPPRAVQAHLAARENGHLDLQVGNLQYLPVEILGVELHGSVAEPDGGAVRLPGRRASRPVEYRTLRFALPKGAPGSASPPDAADGVGDLRVLHRIPGSERVARAAVFAWPQADVRALASDPTRAAPNLAEFPFLAVDESARVIRILPGAWFVRRDVIVPAGYRLRAGPGTRVDLAESAAIVSRSPIEFEGSEDDPIVLRSAGGTGQGLFVDGAGEPSVLAHVRFENLGAPERPGSSLTGAVTFYESPVAISHCSFEGSRAEDALNLVRSSFSISTSLFRGSSADALDVDFADGSLRDSAFVDSANDAVDVSGSAVEISGLRVDGAGDKGLSVGENARVRGERVRIRNATTGIASKDFSQVVLEDVQVEGASVGIAAFQKKPEFGEAQIRLSKLSLAGVETPFLIEERSLLVVDGTPHPGDRRDVRARLYERD